MTTFQKTMVAAALTLVAGVAVFEARQVSRLRTQVETLQLNPSTDELSALQERARVLALENAELTNALAQADAENQRLINEGEQTRRSAALYRELIQQASLKDVNPTNAYPSDRHVWVGFGRMGRIAALSKEDSSARSAEDKSALEAARMKALDDLPNLVKAAKQYSADKSDQPADLLSEELIDKVACLLYGALNLDEHQFNQVCGVMWRVQQEAKQKGLSKETPAAETAEAMQQIMEQWKTETIALLTPEQTRIFVEVSNHFQVEPGNFGFNFSF